MSLKSRTAWNDADAEWRAGEFYKDLSLEAMSEFESLAEPFSCEEGRVIFSEEEEPRSVLFLLEGRVKLTLNSSDGKRLTLGFSGPGEILGLSAAVAGYPYETAAVAKFHCEITSLPRRAFLDFLLRYPVASQNSARMLSVEYKRSCEQLRIIGLTLTARIKLARLLLQWSTGGQPTERGARIRCPLTHQEISEYIGVSRETVTRNLTDFKNNELVEQHGSTFLIPSIRALEMFAGKVDYRARLKSKADDHIQLDDARGERDRIRASA
jgi:CRP/FNR family cyclic AMP-dependent transcriptional regulator